MKLVTYSGKMDIGGSGIGTTAWRQVKPLLDEDLIKHIYAPESKQKPEGMFTVVPSISGPYFFQDTFFDAIVSQIMEYPEILQTWASHCLFQLREFPEATSIVNLYSAHPIVQAKAIGTENIDPVLAKKVIKELEICDHIFIPSEWILSSLKIVGLEHKAKLIPFGVDLKKFTPKKEKQDDTFRVIYVGNNWVRKGLIYLIQSWIDLDLKNAELTIAGVEKLPEELMKKLPENINIGWIPDLAEKYRQSDIFVLPALEDGCPLATYEAMASGLPVIVSSNTGTKQHVFEGVHGFVVPPSDIKELSKKIQYCYDNPELVKKMGRNARKMAEAFPWERHEQLYVKWIKSL